MLAALIRLSLRHRGLVLALAAIILLAGWQVARQMPIDVLPELNKPVVTVLTECAGLSPEEVETRVTRPVERALMGVPGLDRLRSNSDSGLSLVFVEFAWGTDLRSARLLVQERVLTAARVLPEGITPGLTPSTSLMGEVLLIGLSTHDEKTTPAELRTIAETVIRPRLQSIPGVADVLPMGGGVQQIHILPDPRKLTAHQISMHEVQDAVSRASGNATGGVINLNSREMAVRTLGLSTDLTDLRRTPVKIEEDHVILLGDIARVEPGTQPLRGDASVNGTPGVIVSVDKAPGVDTLRLTREIENALAGLKPSLPAAAEVTILFRQADFIESSVSNLREVVRDGAVIVALVLFLFLLNVRTTLITLTAIPLSFAIAFIVFRWMGVSINTMTIGGLAVAMGMVVDDAIVDVENVFRRWRENRQAGQPRSLMEVVASASNEVRGSILYATILVLLTFLPLAALPGLEGQLFTPVAVATTVSVAASFLVSLTVIPVLCSFFLPRRKEITARERRDPAPARWLKTIAERSVIPFALNRPFLVLGITSVALAAAVALFPTMRRSFLPPFQERSATVALISAPGTSLYASTQTGETAVRLLQAIPEIKTVGRRTGRAERDDHIVPVSITEFDVGFKEGGRARAEVLAEIRKVLGTIPGTLVNVGAPISHRLAHMLSGTTSKLAIKIHGPDLEQLRRAGERVAEIAKATPGLVDVALEPQALISRITLTTDRERAIAFGLQVGTISEQVTDLISGRVVARVPQGEQSLELLVRLPSEWTDTPEELGAMPILAPTGQIVPVRALADVHETVGPSVINRENGQPLVVISANATDDDWPSLIGRLNAAIESKANLPAGTYVRYDGEYQAQQAATRRILVLSAVVLVLLAALLYGYFRIGVLAAQVLLNIPLAFIGGMALTWLINREINIATLVGFIAVGGVAARNGILMLSHYLHLLRHEGEQFGARLVIRGTLDRLPPVLMTALSAALALLPLILAAEEPGKELLHPVAVVIIGGLVTSTLLDLCLTPAVFLHFGRRAAESDAAAGR